MRISNLQYAKGTVVICEFDDPNINYLNRKPLIVVGILNPIFGQVIVCSTGTKQKPGIACRLFNYYAGKAIGDCEISTIYPYQLYTISTVNIVRTIGIIDPFIMKEIDKSIKFFMGFSDDIPEYLKDHENCFGVQYTYAMERYIGQNEHVSSKMIDSIRNQRPTHPMSRNPLNNLNLDVKEDRELAEEKKPSTNNVKDFDKKSTKKAADMSALYKVDSTKLYEVYDRLSEEKDWIKIPSKITFGRFLSKILGSDEYKNITREKTFKLFYHGLKLKSEYLEPEAKLIEPEEITKPEVKVEEAQEVIKEAVHDWSEEIRNWVSIEEPIPAEFKKDNWIDKISNESAVMILSRKAPIDAVMEKYKVSEDKANHMREALTQLAIKLANNTLASYAKYQNSNALMRQTTFIKAGIIIALEFNLVQVAPKIRIQLNTELNSLKNRLNIHQNTPAWEGFNG